MLNWRQRLILIFCAILCGALIGYYQITHQNVVVADRGDTSTPLAGLALSAQFDLVNQDGKQVTAQSWPGQYLLVYFGFTHCPDICPLGLTKMTEALAALPPTTQTRIQPLFITVDPARDTPTELKNYVVLFDKRLVGLTGTQSQIDAVIKNFRVYAQKQPVADDPGNYMMNHSSFMYLVAPDGRVIDVFAHEAKATDITAKLNTLVK